MVLARAGNWEMKNIFYYLTNHLNNSQRFCSEFRGAQPAGTNRAVLSRHPQWLIKYAGVGLQSCLCSRICVSRKGVKTQSTSRHGAVGQGCLPDGCLLAARVLCGDRCRTASLRPSPAQSRPQAPETEAGPDGLRGSGCREGVPGCGPHPQPGVWGQQACPVCCFRATSVHAGSCLQP